ncbi:hypothetical protein ACFRR6_01745 [Streptomyces sp. NPDC056891]|uniref:hypothetical protein n=1 Tax=Streptomyces sp. NPDC056891 TaxID=3345961 RepID=UPI0036983372
MNRTHTETSSDARVRILTDMTHAVTLPPEACGAFLADYMDTIHELATAYEDPNAAYLALSNYADDTYERLIEDEEALTG